MEIEAKQRSQKNRRRERAQRMLAQRESLATAKQQQQQQQQSQQSRQRPPNDEEDSHSGEDEDPAGGGVGDGGGGGGAGGGLGLGLGAKTGHPRDGHSRPPRPPRPPRPRKKSSLAAANQKEPPFEEDIVDGFAILAFRTYEELEVSDWDVPPDVRDFPFPFLSRSPSNEIVRAIESWGEAGVAGGAGGGGWEGRMGVAIRPTAYVRHRTCTRHNLKVTHTIPSDCFALVCPPYLFQALGIRAEVRIVRPIRNARDVTHFKQFGLGR